MKEMKLASVEGNNNEHLGAAFKLRSRLQAFCFISLRNRMTSQIHVRYS